MLCSNKLYDVDNECCGYSCELTAVWMLGVSSVSDRKLTKHLSASIYRSETDESMKLLLFPHKSPKPPNSHLSSQPPPPS